MAEKNSNQYHPEVVSRPGETLVDTLNALGLTQTDLAQRMGVSRKTVNEIISSASPITPKMALLLERTLQVPSHFWLNRERHYREYLARIQEREQLNQQIEWLRNFPLPKVFAFNWIAKFKDPVDQLRELLNFFGVANPNQWEAHWQSMSVSWRQSAAYEVNRYAVALWLRKGEIEAQKIVTSQYDQSRFRSALNEIRRNLSANPDSFVPLILEQCIRAGVVVTFVPEIPGTRAYGASRWLKPDKAVIQLSLRGQTDDLLWFTFFHEAGHILFGKKRNIYLEVKAEKRENIDEEEHKANLVASDILIPRNKWLRFTHIGLFTQAEVVRFADVVKVTPGIVVGRLQHDKLLAYNSRLNHLKVKCQPSHLVEIEKDCAAYYASFSESRIA